MRSHPGTPNGRATSTMTPITKRDTIPAPSRRLRYSHPNAIPGLLVERRPYTLGRSNSSESAARVHLDPAVNAPENVPTHPIGLERMDYTSLKNHVVLNAPGSSGPNLQGMAIDFDHFLESSDLFESVAVQTEPKRPGVINASAILRDPTKPVAAVEAELVRIWLDELRYTYLEAHRVKTENGSTVLEFITQIAPSGFYVTGEIYISRGQEPKT